ncbi:MAG TPA: DNA polymerase III subunit chi [Acetobacteraceae bacterium]|nr:DNA polymerase III subunit chi [Acetobacteraceae bacterium]
MADIGFYHLTRTGPDQALPPLLGRTLAAGKRAVIRCDAGRIAAIDTALWVCPDPDWLPHGTEAMGEADLQPIWITDRDEAPNGAGFLFLLDGRDSAHIAQFERVFDLFDGGDANAVAAARARWKAARESGHTLTYWQQGPRGWEKK